AGPHDPVMAPVLEPIDGESAARSLRLGRNRLDLVQPRAWHIAEKRQRGVYVAVRNCAAAAFTACPLRDAVQRLLHAGYRPHGEEEPGSLVKGRLVARGSRPLTGH